MYGHSLLASSFRMMDIPLISDILLSTLQGNLSFSTSSVSSFASTHAGLDYFCLIDPSLASCRLIGLRLEPHHIYCLMDSLVPSTIAIPFPLDVIMTYDSDPDSDPIPSYDIIAYRSLYDKTSTLDPDHTYGHLLLASSFCMMDIPLISDILYNAMTHPGLRR